MYTQTKTTYICQYCGEEYPTETGAIKCENNHAKIKGIESACYKIAKKLPEQITVEFENGETEVYERRWGDGD